jgi:G3E family GTPase
LSIPLMPQTPIIALCGFLGSGKTTLLRRWRRDDAVRNAAVIVHDLSEFGLDAELLSDEESLPAPGKLVDRVAALHGNHAREQLHDSVGTSLQEIAELTPAPPLVLCESTGAARPWPLIKALTQDERFSLRHFIVTVDALNLHRDFADGRVLTGEEPAPQDEALSLAAGVLAEQIAFASIIILTKIDTIPESVVDAQVKTLQKLQPNVAISRNEPINLVWPVSPRQPTMLRPWCFVISGRFILSVYTTPVRPSWGLAFIEPRDSSGWPRVRARSFSGSSPAARSLWR